MEDFFRRVLPSTGPFCLLSGATGPDGKLIEARHWNGYQTHAELAAKAVQLSALPLNVFYAVGSYNGKNRQDPKAKRCFYLDLDGKDFPSLEDAVKQLGLFVKATGLPAPSIYVHSGRGVHVYWCLDRDVSLSEWLPVAAALKSKCADLGFPADAAVTSDPARILRVPGTLNRKENTPIPCRVLSDNGTSHTLEAIAESLAVTQAAPAARLAALVSNDDLKSKRDFESKTAEQVEDMLDHIQLPGVNGRDEWITVLCAVQDWSDKSMEGFELFHDWSSAQPKYVSRDDCWRTWESFCPGGGIGIGTLIRLAKEGGYVETEQPSPVPDALSFASQLAMAATSGVPTAVSGTVPNPQVIAKVTASPLMIAASHVVRASGKIRLELNDAVQWLSNEFVTITDQDGLFYSLTNRAELSRTVIDDLLTRYMPLNANGIPINASAILRRYGTVHSVNAVGFFPGAPPIYKEAGIDYVNNYRNPPDMIPATPNEIRLIDDFWDYCFPREEDQEFGLYLKQFYAHVVQHPDVKIASAPLLVSKEFGTGKTTLMYDIPRALVGPHSAKLVSNKVLRSSFSDYLSGVHFLHFDEVHINGKWDSDDTANSMKNLITGKTVEVHPKGQKPYNIVNRVFITATSNYEDAITLPADDERRWGVYYLRPIRKYSASQKEAYFGLLHRFINSARGAGVLRWYFSHVDLSGFDPQRAPPTTVAKREMVVRSQSVEVQILKEAIDDRDGPFAKDLGTLESVRMYLHTQTGKQWADIACRNFLRRARPDVMNLNQVRIGNGRMRPWVWRDQQKWCNALPTEVSAELKS